MKYIDAGTDHGTEHQNRGRRKYYISLAQKKVAYRDNYIIILLLMTVLALFAAVWIGLILSKRITVPIEALSVATREISGGNLEHRLDIQAEDELGLLVKLFNDMAAGCSSPPKSWRRAAATSKSFWKVFPTGVISLGTDLKIQRMNRAAHSMFSVGECHTPGSDLYGPDARVD